MQLLKKTHRTGKRMSEFVATMHMKTLNLKLKALHTSDAV